MPTTYDAERHDPALSGCARSKLTLRFTGDHLLMEGGKETYSYPATSGSKKFKPIPTGRYWIQPNELWQHTFATELKLWAVSLINPAVNPDSHYAAWGLYRITIHPFADTDTNGRGGFFIHGGSAPGSAGCIDLGHWMDSFVRDLKAELDGNDGCYITLTVS